MRATQSPVVTVKFKRDPKTGGMKKVREKENSSTIHADLEVLRFLIGKLKPLSQERQLRHMAAAVILLELVPPETCQLVLHVATRKG